MKDYKNVISAAIIAVAIIVAGFLVATAIQEASGIIGSQIASALANLQ